ncbi:RNA helicase [Reticulomyxa filosa]|uniref:RNA helicase n=1 Tax=Reticulomyxa filosa TaxID=46433 RepID=X6N7C8_RETFI|nr:RNA helicase [Reticulomyxa filosa]|eukprot:ETO21916.1 RNA helicase [Reticulomyxa filosa]
MANTALPGRVQVVPPIKGVFPLDHFKECKRAEFAYLHCVKKHNGETYHCSSLIKDFLNCRMDRSLMKREDLKQLGIPDTPEQTKNQFFFQFKIKFVPILCNFGLLLKKIIKFLNLGSINYYYSNFLFIFKNATDFIFENLEQLWKVFFVFDLKGKIKMAGREKGLIQRIKNKTIKKMAQDLLPVSRHEKEIIRTVAKNQVVLIVGATGSGKTTQVPQFMLELKREQVGKSTQVICTQPRQVAATSVAERVAKEMNCSLGSTVGYQIRFERKASDNTELMYVTEGILVRWILSPEHANFKGFSIVIVDEAHERTVNTDILMALLKKRIQMSKDSNNKDMPFFRAVIMSATMDKNRFQSYFPGNPDVVDIPGRVYPVARNFLSEPVQDYVKTAAEIAYGIHSSLGNESGDILIFLTGSQEIDDCIRHIDDLKRGSQSPRELLAIKFHSHIANAKQDVFRKALSSQRKCVVATNIAETSLTIDGIVYVIDCGMSKQKLYDEAKHVDALEIRPISKASVKQRVGRAGRTKPGMSFHLYPLKNYEMLENENQPEILRVSMIYETLCMLALGIENPLEFDYIDPPSETTVARAVNMLFHLKAIDDKGKLTKEGKHLTDFPLDPRLSKALLAASKYGVVNEVLSIAAMLEIHEKLSGRSDSKDNNSDDDDNNGDDDNDNDGNGYGRRYKKGPSQNRPKNPMKIYKHCDGDHLTLLNIFNAYKHKHFQESGYYRDPNVGHLERADKIRGRLEFALLRILPEIKTSDQCDYKSRHYYPNILKALLSGYFLNVATYGYADKYWTFRLASLNDKHKVVEFLDRAKPHRSSVFGGNKVQRRPWVFFHEVVVQQTVFLRILSAIQPKWLLEVAPDYFNVEQLARDKSSVASILRDLRNASS